MLKTLSKTKMPMSCQPKKDYGYKRMSTSIKILTQRALRPVGKKTTREWSNQQEIQVVNMERQRWMDFRFKPGNITTKLYLKLARLTTRVIQWGVGDKICSKCFDNKMDVNNLRRELPKLKNSSVKCSDCKNRRKVKIMTKFQKHKTLLPFLSLSVELLQLDIRSWRKVILDKPLRIWDLQDFKQLWPTLKH